MTTAQDYYLEQYNADIADYDEDESGAAVPKKTKVPFPWLMFIVALLFDGVGLFLVLLSLIPIVGVVIDIVVTPIWELFAGLTFWLWQKIYAPKANALWNIGAAKLFDFITMGFLPSNIITVLATWLNKRRSAKNP